ncbi:LPS translocon maturation chaperone LptM [Nitrosomonas eutropha]
MMRILGLILLLQLLLSACGYKSSLYLPQDQPVKNNKQEKS